MKPDLKIPVKALFVILLFLQSNTLFAQALPDMVPYVHNGKWGYADTNGNIKIKPQWDRVDFFMNGLATTTFERKSRTIYCVINKKGEYVIGPERNWNGQIFKSFAENKQAGFNAHDANDKYGIIDASGRTVIPLIYDKPNQYSSSTQLQEARWSGAFLYDSLRRRFCAVAIKDGKVGLIDTNNKVLIPFQYNGLFRVFDKYNCPPRFYVVYVGDKRGLIDTANNMIVPPIYDHVMFSSHDFSKGIWLHKDKRRLIADTNGKIIVDAPGYSADFPGDSLIPAYKLETGKYGVLNFKYEEVIPFIYWHTSVSNDSLLIMKDSVIANKEGHYYFRRFFNTKTLQPITDWYTDDYRLLPESERKQSTQTPEPSYGSHRFHILGKDVTYFEKDEIIWTSPTYLMKWPEGYTSVRGMRTQDSVMFTALLDTNGHYVIAPEKTNYQILSINPKDSLLVVQQTDGKHSYYVTDFHFKEKTAFQEREITVAFTNKKRLYFIDVLKVSFYSGSYDRYEVTYTLRTDDSLLTNKFKEYKLTSFCNKDGIAKDNYGSNFQNPEKFEGYFTAKKGDNIGIIDINADVIYPDISFKYQKFDPVGDGIFHVQAYVPHYNGYERLIITEPITNYPQKGQPYLVNTENKVLLDSFTVQRIYKVRPYINGKLQNEISLFQVELQNPQRNGISEYREPSWFYMDKRGRAYHGALVP